MENGQRKSAIKLTSAIRDFKDLQMWKTARELRKMIFDLTKSFPKEERYILFSQMRRAAVSVTANIAEGYGRFSYQESIQFCRQSRASVYELRDHRTSVLDAGYSPIEKLKGIDRLAMSEIRLLNGYIRSTKNRKEKAES